MLALLRLGIVGQEPIAAPDDLLPLLVATALLCVAGLTLHTHGTINWLAIIGAAAVTTADLARYAREVRPVVDDDAWRWLGIAVSLSALLALGAAAAYASSRRRLPGTWVTVNGIAIILVVAAAAAWAIANPSDATFGALVDTPLGSLGLVTRAFLILTTAFVAIGVVGDVVPPAERAWRRVALTHRTSSGRVEKLRAWARAFVDELSPGRRMARSAVLGERSRMARDLHADVVPGLRAALADAERGASPDQLAAALREVLADVEAAGGAQHPIQFEIGGLVPALEWLAERVERRASVPVTLDVDDSAGDAGEPPRDVALTAFRVAALALGNVVAHAPGAARRSRSEPGPSRSSCPSRTTAPGSPRKHSRRPGRTDGGGSPTWPQRPRRAARSLMSDRRRAAPGRSSRSPGEPADTTVRGRRWGNPSNAGSSEAPISPRSADRDAPFLPETGSQERRPHGPTSHVSARSWLEPRPQMPARAWPSTRSSWPSSPSSRSSP